MEALYEAVYAGAKPRIAKAIAEKETELETLLDGFAGLSPKLKDRANQRGEALQKEIDTLQRNLQDLRIPWERLRTELAARQEALELATATLNQEGHFRQKAEALKTVIGRIVCHFGRKGKRCFLKSIDIYAPEVAAVRPLTFLESPHSNSCQDAKPDLYSYDGTIMLMSATFGGQCRGCLRPSSATARSYTPRPNHQPLAHGRPRLLSRLPLIPTGIAREPSCHPRIARTLPFHFPPYH
jgi:chaperonin cofactor prefoldin